MSLGRVQRIAQLYGGKCALELGMRELYVGLHGKRQSITHNSCVDRGPQFAVSQPR